MLRLTIAGIIAIGLIAGTSVAQVRMDCNALYKGFWDQFIPTKYASATAEEFANISRIALRAYDACQAGDEFNAKNFFDSLPRA